MRVVEWGLELAALAAFVEGDVREVVEANASGVMVSEDAWIDDSIANEETRASWIEWIILNKVSWVGLIRSFQEMDEAVTWVIIYCVLLLCVIIHNIVKEGVTGVCCERDMMQFIPRSDSSERRCNPHRHHGHSSSMPCVPW